MRTCKVPRRVVALICALGLLTGLAGAGEFHDVTADSQTFTAYFEEYDGESWLLIGRGRRNWEFDTNGQGIVGDVSQYLKAEAGFAPAAYSDAIVNDLLSQASLTFPGAVTVRVMRATSIDGTATYQDSRWTGLGGTSFTFDFDSSISVTHTILNPDDTPLNDNKGTDPYATNTKDNSSQSGDDGDRLFTFDYQSTRGFRYGNSSGISASTAANSFVYGGSYPAPYTEVYIAYPMPSGSPIIFSDLTASDITMTSATFNATLEVPETNAAVYAHWWIDGGATNSASVGSSTNEASTNISYEATGLAAGTEYFYTFSGSNDTTNILHDSSGSFLTLVGGEWSGAADDLWGTAGNWAGSAIPDTAGEPATFSGYGPGDVDLNGSSYTVQDVTLSGGDYSLVDSSGTPGTLSAGGLTNSAGDNMVSVGMTLSGDLEVAGGSLTLMDPGNFSASTFQLSGGTLAAQGGGSILPVRDGLEAWYDASTLALADNAAVTAWADQSGNGRNLVTYEGTPNFKLNAVNGLPAVNFRSENLQMAVANPYLPMDVYLVLRSDYNNANKLFGSNWGAPIGVKDGPDGDRMWMLQANEDRFWDQELPSAVSHNGRAVSSANNFDMGGINADVYMVLKVTMGPNNGTQVRNVIVGSRTDQWNGQYFDTAEIIAYNRVLSGAEEDAVGGYLAEKYGITTTYPPTVQGSGAVSFPTIPVNVALDSTISVLATNRSAFGDLTVSDGATLTTSGSEMGFESTTIAGGATAVGFDAGTTTYLTQTAGVDGSGASVTITKSGGAGLILDKAASNLPSGATFDVTAGSLVAVGSTSIGSAGLELSGGTLALSSPSGNQVYDKALTVDADSTLTAGLHGSGVAGPLTVSLGSAGNDMTVSSGTLSVSATDSYTLELRGNQSGNMNIIEGSVSLATTAVTLGSVTLSGGTLTANNNLTAAALIGAGGAFAMSGPYDLTVANALTVGANMDFSSSSLDVSTAAVTINSGATLTDDVPLTAASWNISGAVSAPAPLTATTKFNFEPTMTVANTLTGSGYLHLGDSDLYNGYVALTAANSYAGRTEIERAVLQADIGQGIPATSRIVFNQNSRDQTAILETSGTFARNIGTADGEVYWQNMGGFSAKGADLTVTLEGGAELVWASATDGFNNRDSIQFGSETADSKVELTNPIDLGNATRRIQVFDNSDSTMTTDVARLSGIIQSTGGADNNDWLRFNDSTGNGCDSGLIELTGANTYAQRTAIDNITLYAIDGVGLPANSMLYLSSNNDGWEGIFLSSGTLNRNIGVNAGEVYWDARGGFAARGGPFVVTLEGGAMLDWSDTYTGFRSQNLQLNSRYADNVVELVNPIQLDSTRYVDVWDNTHTDQDVGKLSGIISQDASNRILRKRRDGTLWLTGANTYAGDTWIDDGAIRAVDGVGLPSSSQLYLEGDSDWRPAVLESSGTFLRNIANADGNNVYWASRGGFAAYGGPLTVNLESGATLLWGDANVGFRGQRLHLGSRTANDVVTIANDISGQNGNRYMHVYDNPHSDSDYAQFTGVLSSFNQFYLYGDGTLVIANRLETRQDSNGDRIDVRGDATLKVAEGASLVSGQLSTWPTGMQEIYIQERGSLIVNGSVTSSYVEVQNNSSYTKRLGGNGSLWVRDRAYIGPGGVLSPGADGVGTLTFEFYNGSKNLELDPNASYEWELGPSGSDQVDITGDLRLENGWKLKLVGAGGAPLTEQEYTLFTYTDAMELSLYQPVLDTSEMPADWRTDTLSIVNDTTSTPKRIYMTGLYSVLSVANQPIGDIGATSATANAVLSCEGETLHATVYWSTNDWGTVRVDWEANASSADAGSFTNEIGTAISGSMTGLSADTQYYYTFRATNDAASVDLLAAPAVAFRTQGPPEVTTAGGATDSAFGTATLRGLLTNGISANATICWGTVDGGTNSPGDWENVIQVGAVDQDAVFASAVSNLLYGIGYEYRVYVTNDVGDVWSALELFASLPPSGDPILPVTNNLEVWFDGAVGVTSDGSGVTTWEDQSGNAHHATRTTGNAVLTEDSINALPALIFRGNNDDLNLAGTFFAKEHYYVFRGNPARTTWSNYGSVLGKQTDDRNSSYLFENNSRGFHNNQYPAQVHRDGPTDLTVNNTTTLAPVEQYMVVKLVMTDIQTNPTAYKIGGQGGYRNEFDVAEIIAYSSANTLADENQIGDYLAQKYGITTSYSGYVPPASMAIATTAATNIGSTTADLGGTLDATGSVFTVYTYWSTTSNETAEAWLADGTAGSALVGTYTNLTGQSVAASATGLVSETTYYYTMAATNESTNIWAASNASFTTVGPPTVGLGGGVTALGIGTATLRGELTGGVLATATLCWGSVDGGTNSTGDWEHTVAMGVVNVGVAFSNVLSGLYYGIEYDYRVFVTNDAGSVWSDVESFATDIPDFSYLGSLAWDFETGDLSKWNVDTTVHGDDIIFTSGYQPVTALKQEGSYGVATYYRQGSGQGDGFTGIMQTDPFSVGAGAGLTFYIAAGNHPFTGDPDAPAFGMACVNLEREVSPGDWEMVETATHANNWTWALKSFDLTAYEGDTLRVRVYDTETGSWGHTAVDNIKVTNVLFSSGVTLAISNAAASSIRATTADIGSTLDGEGAVFSVYAYYSTNSAPTNAAAWMAAGATRTLIGTYTNVTAQSLTLPLSGLTRGTTYYYTMQATNDVTELWATPTASFTADGSGPEPNPMTFEIEPAAIDENNVIMTATTAIDALNNPVQYFFQNTNNNDETGWTSSTVWTNGGLTTGVTYGYRVKARDAETNETAWSDIFTAKPAGDVVPPTPNPVTWVSVPAALDDSSIAMTISSATDPNGPVTYEFQNVSNSQSSGWISGTTWTNTGLTARTVYGYRARAQDAIGNKTTWTPTYEIWCAPLLWDANGASGALQTDGDGTWFDAGQWWNGATNVAWEDATLNNATIGNGGAGGTITLGDVTAGSVTFTNFTGTYVLSGGSLTNDAGIHVAPSAGAVTINTPVGGTGGVTKDGSGVLRLAGANGFSGGTVLNQGTLWVSADANLGQAGTGIIVNDTAVLSFGDNTAGGQIIDLGTRPITVNNSALAGLYFNGANKTITTAGDVTGDGGIIWAKDPVVTYGGGSGYEKLNLLGTGNTFTGPITIGLNTENASGGGGTLTVRSLADSADPITFNMSGGNNYLILDADAVADLTLMTRPLRLAYSRVYLQNNSTTYGMTFGGPASAYTGGAKTLYLTGSGGGTYAGNISDGAGTLALNKSSGTWTLSGTNTYSGITTIGSGTLVVEGSPALADGTKLVFGRSTTLSLRSDDAGTVNFGNEVEGTAVDTSTSITTTYTIDVRNNGGATTGSTIALGLIDFTASDQRSGRQIIVTGDNGYSLQVGNVDLSTAIRGTVAGGPQRFRPNTATLSITGTVKQVLGNTGSSTVDNNLYLGGTASGNMVSGVIADADDYSSNANAKPLNVYKGEAGDWTLSAVNTYSGTTTIGAGLLRVTGSASGSAVTVTSASGVNGYLGGTGTVGAVTLNSTGGIDLKDALVGTLALGGDLSINGAAGANDLYFDLGTGANGTDKITVAGNVTMTTSGAGVVSLNQLSGTKINAGTYDLIVATGAMPTVDTFTLATTTAFGNNFALQVTGSTLQVVVTSAVAAPAIAFWKGASDNNWSTLANWVDGAGTVLSGLPGFNTDVSFYATGASRLTTGILDTDFDINSLTYTAAATAATTIGGAPKKVILEAASGDGITVNTPSAGTPVHTISANVSIAADQNWTVDTGAALTVGGVIDDFGAGKALTKAGVGTLRLSGLNTYVGPTVVDEGVLEVWHYSVGNAAVPSALGMSSADAANLVLNPGATLEFVITGDAGRSTDRGFTINGTSNGDSATLKSTKSGTQAYRGVQFTSTASPAYGTPNQARTLILRGTQASGGGNYNNNTRLYAYIADNGSGAVSLLKTDVGSWALYGNSTYSGGTTISGGALRMGKVNALPSAGAVTLADVSGAALVLDNYSQTIGSLSGGGGSGGNVTLGSGSLTVGDGTSTAYAGVISGTGSLTKQGTGTLTLAEDNTYSGATTISGGTLQLGTGGVAGALNASSAISVGAGAALTVNRSDSVAQGLMFSGIAIQGAGGVTQAGSGTLTLNAANTYTGLTDAQAGELELNTTGANAISGDLQVSGGTAKLLQADQIADGGTVTVNSGTFALQAYDETVGGVVLAGGTISGAGGTLTSTTAFDVRDGAASAILGGTVGLTKSTAGTVTLTAANTYSGATSVSAGTLQLGNGGASGSLDTGSAISVSDTAIFAVNQADTVTQGIDFSGAAITGAGGFQQIGGGTTVVTAANSYTGTTTVIAGTLQLSGSLAAGSAVTVDGGMLSGTGTVNGSLAVGAAGSLMPGATPGAVGTLTIGNGLDISAMADGGSGKLIFDLDTPLTSDKLGVTGILTIGAGVLGFSDFIFSDLGGFGPGTYTLVSATAPVSGSLAGSVSGTVGGKSATLQIVGNDLVLVVSGGNAPPTVASPSATLIGTTNAMLGATITTNGGETVTSWGTTWSANPGGQTENMLAVAGETNGPFAQLRTGFSAGDHYYAWAWASNVQGRAFSTSTDFYTEPDQASSPLVTDVQVTQLGVSWSTNATMGGVLVLMKQGSAVDTVPTDGATYTASSVFTSGQDIGGGNRVVYVGSGTNVTVTGLTWFQDYHVAVFAYAGSGGLINYQANNAPTAQATTLTRTLTWDASTGTALAQDGAGNWGDGGLNWYFEGANTAWSSADPDNAIIGSGGVGGVITVGTVTAGDVTFTDFTGTYTLSGGSLAVDGGLSVAANAGSVSISTPISGDGSVTKDGSGTLTLSGANAYTGGTVIRGGNVNYTANSHLGVADSGITFDGTGGLSSGLWGTLDLGARPITINNTATAGLYFHNANSVVLTSGDVTGDGGIIWARDPVTSYGGGSGKVELKLLGTGNTFTGPITIGLNTENASGGGGWMTVRSLGDSISPITFNMSGGVNKLILDASASADLVLMNRPLQLAYPTVYLQNDNTTYSMTFGGPASAYTTGTKNLYFLGSGSGTYAGNISDGVGTMALTKSTSVAWDLSGTNTFSGNTTISSGTLRILGKDAMSPSSKIYMHRSTTISLRADDAGTVNLGNELEVYAIDTSSGVTSTYTVDVRNNGGPTTGSTIALGKIDFVGGGGNFASARNIVVTGDNGYRLQVGDVDMNVSSASVNAYANQGFRPLSAPLTIAGSVKQIDGNTGNTTANKLYLGGTVSGNLVSGVIANPDDYSDNIKAQPLQVVKGESGEWTLSAVNTYSGTTTVNAGLLRVNGSASSSTVAVASTSGVDGYLGGTGAVGAVTLNSTGGIDLKDGVVGTLSLGGDLNINGAAGANNLYFDLGTGANGTDQVTVNGDVNMITSGAGVINLNQLSGTKIDEGTYDLIAATGTMVALSNFDLATTSAFGNTFSLQLDGTAKTLQLVVTPAATAPPTAFWAGGVNENWSTPGNWYTDATSAIALTNTPGYNTDVRFYAVGAVRLTTGTLDTDFDINSLIYTVDATANTTIGGSTQTLILEAASGTGLVVNTPASGTPTHTIQANIAMAASQTWSADSGAALTMNGVVSDFGAGRSLTKAGAGTLSLGAPTLTTTTGYNTYSGPTVIHAGTLIVNRLANVTAANPLGMSSAAPANLVLDNGATLKIVHNRDAVFSTDRGFTINGTVDGDSATLDSSPTSWRGVWFTSTASPAYGTPNQARSLILGGTHAAGGNNRDNNNRLYAHVADNGTGPVSLLKTGPGSWQLRGNNTYTGGTTIESGSLRLGVANTLPASGAVTLADAAGAVLDLSDSLDSRGYNQTIGSLSGGGSAGGNVNLGIGTLTVGDATSTTYAGLISGTGGLTKQGVGTLTLTGDNTHSGATTINGGTLVVNGTLDFSAVTVNSGGTLAGTGSIGQATPVNVVAGGTLAPGDPMGTLTVHSATVAGTLDITFSGNAVADLVVNNTLDISGSALNVTGFTSGSPSVIATYGLLAGTFASTSGLPDGWWVDYAYEGADAIAIVPPPGSMFLFR